MKSFEPIKAEIKREHPPQQSTQRKSRGYHFLFAPVILSFLALALLLSPAKAGTDEKDKAFGACPYLQQVHQGVTMPAPAAIPGLQLTSTEGLGHTGLRPGPVVKTYQF